MTTENSRLSRLSFWDEDIMFCLDLNELRRINNESQAGILSDKNNPANNLYVTSDAHIVSGAENPDMSLSRATNLQTDTTFYTIALATATTVMSPTERMRYEEGIAQNRMPRGTRHIAQDSDSGWVYEFVNEFADNYIMFLYYDQAADTYKVALLYPELEDGSVGAHACHIYHSGILCLRHPSVGGPGYPAMEDAFARSVLWSLGCSCYMRGLGFQFNIGQES